MSIEPNISCRHVLAKPVTIWEHTVFKASSLQCYSSSQSKVSEEALLLSKSCHLSDLEIYSANFVRGMDFVSAPRLILEGE